MSASTVAEAVMKTYDTSGDGKFAEKEFGNMCFALGHYLSPAEQTAAFAALDRDGSGYIEKDEFMSWWRTDDRFSHLRLNADKEKRVIDFARFFMNYDFDRSGQLETGGEFEKLVETLTNAGYAMPKGGAAGALKALDSNKDGSVSFNEFLRYIMQL